MMPPWPRSAIARSAAWLSRSTAVTSTSSISVSSSAVLSRKRFFSPNPALLTSRSTGRSWSARRGLDMPEAARSVEVGDEHLDLDLVGAAQLLGHLLEALGVAGDEDEVVAAGGELDGVLVADAGGRAGDQGGAAGGGHGPSISGRPRRPRPRPAQWATMSTKSRGAAPVTLAVANQKGGVAKTTSVASIGAALAELGHRVLLVDLDPQACLTFSLGIDPEDLEISVHHVLTKGVDAFEVILATDDGVTSCPRRSSWPAPRPTC